MLSSQHFDDEVGVIDTLLVGGLGCGHEVSVDLSPPLGSSPSNNLAHHHKCSGSQLSAVVVSRDVGITHEVQQPVEFLLTAGLEPGHIGMAGELGVGDETTEADADPALLGFVSGRLCDKGVGVYGVEAVGEFLDPFIRCYLQSLVCVSKQMDPAELVDHPLASAVGTHEVRNDGALIRRDDVPVFVQLAQQLLDDLVAAALVEVEVGQATVGHQPSPELLAILPPGRLVHVEPGVHQRSLQDFLGHRLGASCGPIEHLIDATGGDLQPHVPLEVLGNFMEAQPHVVAQVQGEPQRTGSKLRCSLKGGGAVFRGQLAPEDSTALFALVLEKDISLYFDSRWDDVLYDNLFGISRGYGHPVAIVALVQGSLHLFVDLVWNFALGTFVALLAPRFFPFPRLVLLFGAAPRPTAVSSLPFFDDASLLLDYSILLLEGLLQFLNGLFELRNTLAQRLVFLENRLFNGRHTHCRSQVKKDWNPESTRDQITIRSSRISSLKTVRWLVKLNEKKTAKQLLYIGVEGDINGAC